ncbi:EF-hand_domain pair [Hexamita inflata]|uniref:EF-hand domain pair n=1 Tax=Hexamita inflata TaxID=28002 RepID=A0AA86P4F6_9EUKA|nr:EF-hand domain pair [Hexamita inflata]
MLKDCKTSFRDCNDPKIDIESDSVHEFLLSPKSEGSPVDVCEIHWVLRKYFPDIPQRCAITISKLIDDNQDGIIQRVEFNKLSKILKRVKRDEDIFNVIFAAADSNNDDYIDSRELKIIKDKLKLDFEIPQTQLNKNEFKSFMSPFTKEIIGQKFEEKTVKIGSDEVNYLLGPNSINIMSSTKVTNELFEQIFEKLKK